MNPQIFMIQLFYRIKPSTQTFDLAYVYHNMPASFTVYFSVASISGGANTLYIKNKNITAIGDAVKLIPISAIKSYAQSNGASQADSVNNVYSNWNASQSWGTGLLAGITTVEGGNVVDKCIAAPASANPPAVSSISDPSNAPKTSFTPTKFGDTISIQCNYMTLAPTQSAISSAGANDNGYMNLANVYLTFPSSICN
jgi:hypothetical protein